MEDEALRLDPQIDYNAVQGLSSEAREKLFIVRPASIVRSISPFALHIVVVLHEVWWLF
jgi:tRNA U34 5-carboxymethylaminomethyl modifying enzyme MnmG/GidA